MALKSPETGNMYLNKELLSLLFRYHDKVIIEEELNQVRMEQQEEWEMAKHNLKMAKKTLSQESLSR